MSHLGVMMDGRSSFEHNHGIHIHWAHIFLGGIRHSSSKWMDEDNEGFNQETCAFNLDGSNRKEDQVEKEDAFPPQYMGTLDEVE
jgi:hypothetical protein